jgi:hypothetical protein
MTKSGKGTKIMIPSLIIVLALFLVGASKVTTQLKFRKEMSRLVSEKVISWHNQMSLEVTGMDRTSWQSNGRMQPLELLRACAIEQNMNE